jgi:acetylglutamate kinase
VTTLAQGHGSRECWEAGCRHYLCQTAAGIDQVVVERALANRRLEPKSRRYFRLTPNERVEIVRRVLDAKGTAEDLHAICNVTVATGERLLSQAQHLRMQQTRLGHSSVS